MTNGSATTWQPAAGRCARERWLVPGRGRRRRRAGGLQEALGTIADGSLVLVDGLVASAVPEVLVPASRRLRLVLLVHMPIGVDDDRPGHSRTRRSGPRLGGRGGHHQLLVPSLAARGLRSGSGAGPRRPARRRRRRPGGRERPRAEPALRRRGDARQGPRRAPGRTGPDRRPDLAMRVRRVADPGARLRGGPAAGRPRRSPRRPVCADRSTYGARARGVVRRSRRARAPQPRRDLRHGRDGGVGTGTSGAGPARGRRPGGARRDPRRATARDAPPAR